MGDEMKFISNEEIEKIIKTIKEKYDSKISEINKHFVFVSKNYDMITFQNIIESQKKLTTEIILNIIKHFPLLEKCDFIMFNGSYSRATNILYSDIDLNIMYQDKYKDEIFPIELTINYILSKVFGFRGCDRIHTIMVYTKLIGDECPQLEIKGLTYKKNIIPYYCRENYEQLLFETFNTTRNYKKLLEYFKSTDSIFNEWEYNFDLVKDYGQYDEFIVKIDVDKNKPKNYNNLLKEEIGKLKDKILEFEYLDFNGNQVYIKDINKKVKGLPMEVLYKAVAMLSVSKGLNFVNVKKLIDLKIIDKEFGDSIYKYLCSLMKVQLIFSERLNKDLSSHSSQYIDGNLLCEYYYKEYEQNILDSTNYSIENLFNNIIRILEGDIYEEK